MTLTVDAFITKWTASGGSERANYVSFLNDLCDIIGAPHPDATREDEALNNYVYERAVTFHHDAGTTSVGRIDLYKRDCFVLEAKQGAGTVAATQTEAPFVLSAPEPETKKKKAGTAKRGTAGWSDAMERAFGQAKGYARALPKDHGYPPFIIVVDVGHSIDLYVDFARSGKFWSQFPDAHSFRITMEDLRDEKIRARLKTVFTDPMSLDPSRYAAAVTRELAAKLADLAKSLEAAGHNAESVATFLMRCLFTLFSEDIGLLKKESFQHYLEGLRAQPHAAAAALTALWRDMNTGSPFNAAVMGPVLRFNGGLFADASALPLDAQQIDLLIHAAKADWTNVEPAIFGTLLERALDPVERHRLGAHYTPRAYVERLVIPTVIEPLREDWEAVRTAAVMAANRGEQAAAIAFVREFHGKLCNTRVLDPACGSGNFLYVTLEHMKRLEGEVLQMLYELDEKQGFLDLTEVTVDPHQFLGIEVNVRAAKIAEMVLWIGYLQWHYRTRGQVNPPEPVIRDFKNIECRDAVLDWDGAPVRELERNESGVPVTRWDGRSMKKHPVTGEDVPDETKTVPVWRYVNPRKAEWPKAEFVVGNPPFIGNKRMRTALGDGYVEALRGAFPGVSDNVDLVMYWWAIAANSVRLGAVRAAGLITTNSITQIFNRQVLKDQIETGGCRIAFGVPDHPWVDATDGAAVRIAMVVMDNKPGAGRRAVVVDEVDGAESASVTLAFTDGEIQADLRVGAAVVAAVPLSSNLGICRQGVKLVGPRDSDGFVVQAEELSKFGGVGAVVKPYVSNRELVQVKRDRYVIDFFGHDELSACSVNPAAYQRLHDTVRPFRMENRDPQRRRSWWLFGRSNSDMRASLIGLHRFIVTPEVAKHRPFAFVPSGTIPDASLYAVAASDAYVLGVLSGRIHVAWSLAAGGTLEDRPRYQNGPCFEPFPFPAATENQRARIRDLGEQLDAHRKRQQAAHPDLTITGMYNVLEKLRSGEPLNPKDKAIHEQGLVSVLKQVHDELDIAVFDAYGWPSDLTDEQILERLVALNAERAEEEKRGLIRWLRPEYQNPAGQAATAQVLDLGEAAEVVSAAVTAPKPWPKTMPDQVALIRDALAGAGTVSAKALAKLYKGVGPEKVEEVLVTLAALGQARMLDDGRFVGVRAA